MPILCLDVGFSATGWAVIEANSILAYGVIDPTARTKQAKLAEKKLSQAQRDITTMRILAKRLQLIAEDYSITRVIGEVPGGGIKGRRGARGLICNGMAKATCGVALMDYPCEWLAPSITKSHAVAAVQERWPGWEPTGVNPAGIRHHVFDALSVYLVATKEEESKP